MRFRKARSFRLAGGATRRGGGDAWLPGLRWLTEFRAVFVLFVAFLAISSSPAGCSGLWFMLNRRLLTSPPHFARSGSDSAGRNGSAAWVTTRQKPFREPPLRGENACHPQMAGISRAPHSHAGRRTILPTTSISHSHSGSSTPQSAGAGGSAPPWPGAETSFCRRRRASSRPGRCTSCWPAPRRPGPW